MCFQAFYQKDMTVLSFCKQTLHLPWFCRLRASAGEGAGGRQHLPPPHLFEKKKLRNTHFQWKGIFDGIRIFVWRTSPTHRNLWLVRFDPISSVAILYKTALSRRLLRFHQPGDVIYKNGVFFIKVLKSPRSYDFLKGLVHDNAHVWVLTLADRF